MNQKITKPLFSFFLLLILLFSIPLTIASYSIGTPQTLASGVIDDYHKPFGSNNHRVFYNEDSQRWYFLYDKDGSSAPYYVNLAYYYSDSGDPSTWNDGGTLITALSYWQTSTMAVQCQTSNMASWVYDNTNDIGHLAYVKYTAGHPVLYYINFTFLGGGAVSLGDSRIVWDNGTLSTNKGTVDICLTWDQKPVIVYGGCSGTPYNYFVDIIYNVDGNLYDGALTWYTDNPPVDYSRNHVSIMPTGNDSIIFLSTDSAVARLLYGAKITLGSTTNGSYTWEQFSDEALFVDQAPHDLWVVTYSSSYNTTHGFISYTRDSDHTLVSSVFDFATLTFSDEYEAIDYSSSVTTDWNFASGLCLDDNEPFVTSVVSYGSYYAKCYINEYHQTGYTSYFNVSAQANVTDSIARGNGFEIPCGQMAKNTNSVGYTLYCYSEGIDVRVLVIYLNGEYEVLTPSDVDNIISALVSAGVVILVILFCGWLGWKFGGGFGGLVGINVGVLLCVLFMGFPFYSLVLLIIIDIYVIVKGGGI